MSFMYESACATCACTFINDNTLKYMIAYNHALSSTLAASDVHVLRNDSTGEIAWTDRDSRESEVGTPT